LLPALDKIADPDMVNQLLIEFCDPEPPPTNPDPPTERVEVLSQFSVPNASSRPVRMCNYRVFSFYDITIVMVKGAGRDTGFSTIIIWLSVECMGEQVSIIALPHSEACFLLSYD